MLWITFFTKYKMAALFHYHIGIIDITYGKQCYCAYRSVIHTTMTCSNAKDNIHFLIIFLTLLRNGSTFIKFIHSLWNCWKKSSIAVENIYIESLQIWLTISTYRIYWHNHRFNSISKCIRSMGTTPISYLFGSKDGLYTNGISRQVIKIRTGSRALNWSIFLDSIFFTTAWI